MVKDATDPCAVTATLPSCVVLLQVPAGVSSARMAHSHIFGAVQGWKS